MLPRDRGRAFFPTRIVASALAVFCAASISHAFDVKRVDVSVVRIIMLEVKDGKRTGQGKIGTGFVIDGEYLLTNEHVVNATSYTQKGSTVDLLVVDGSLKNLRKAQVIWEAADSDLAVIKVPGLNRPVVTLSTAPPASYPDKTHIVWAIGYPGMADDALVGDVAFVSSTVTKGVVAKVAVGKSEDSAKEKARPIIQHDAAIHGGNSGGPLFDNCGVVLGVNTYRPVTVLKVDKQEAAGEANAGIFFSPHIVTFLEYQKSAPQLNSLRLTTSSSVCPTALGETGGLPGWAYGAFAFLGLLGIATTVLALRKGTTREVVRMVESYSAYVKRKGRPPSDESMQPRKVSSPPDISSMPGSGGQGADAASAPLTAKPGGGGWKLDGKGSKGQAVKLSVSAKDMETAMAKKEAGIILGRSGTLADLRIEDETVSRRHAKVYVAEAGLAIEDLKSAYGTEVNGHKLEPFQAVELKAGDRVKLGGVELGFAHAK